MAGQASSGGGRSEGDKGIAEDGDVVQEVLLLGVGELLLLGVESQPLELVKGDGETLSGHCRCGQTPVDRRERQNPR